MKNIVSTDHAPKALGSYSQAVITNAQRLVFCSGQIPIDPVSGDLVTSGIREQTDRVLKNLKAILEAAGSSLDNVIKITVYLKDMGDFAAFNDVYAGFFDSDPPARAAVQVAKLPRDASIEVDAIAVL